MYSALATISSAVLVWRHFTWTLDTQDGSCDMRHRTCRNISLTQRCATTRPKLSLSSSRSLVTAVSTLRRSAIDRRLEGLTLALPPPGPVVGLLLQLLSDEEVVDEVGVGVAAQQPAGVGPRQLAPLHLDTLGYWTLGYCDGATGVLEPPTWLTLQMVRAGKVRSASGAEASAIVVRGLC